MWQNEWVVNVLSCPCFPGTVLHYGPDDGRGHPCAPAIEDQVSLVFPLDQCRSNHEKIPLYRIADPGAEWHHPIKHKWTLCDICTGGTGRLGRWRGLRPFVCRFAKEIYNLKNVPPSPSIISIFQALPCVPVFA